MWDMLSNGEYVENSMSELRCQAHCFHSCFWEGRCWWWLNFAEVCGGLAAALRWVGYVASSTVLAVSSFWSPSVHPLKRGLSISEWTLMIRPHLTWDPGTRWPRVYQWLLTLQV